MHVSHPFAFTYINLGLGNTVTNFNISLLGDFNQTGNGSFCLPQVGRAALAQAGIVAGTNASLQFVQISHTGNALYNVSFGVPIFRTSLRASVLSPSLPPILPFSHTAAGE